jgi:transposase
LAFDAGGEAGERLLRALGTPVSHDTLLRLIRNEPEKEMKTPRVLGIDDWAKRKGQSYGTILVDLEAHEPVDLLPDRSAELVAEWLEAHPGVEIISRDRGVEYIKGANEGAPDAIQVADRWHLLKNIRDALKQMLETRRACLKAAADQPDKDMAEQKNKESTSAMGELSDSTRKLTKAEKRTLERRARRQERYETVKELYKLGVSKSEIGRRLGLDFRTVAKYIKADECPIYAGGRSGSSLLAPYMDYMTRRWDEGCHNATRIWREIRKQGFDGSRRIVGEWATEKRKSASASASVALPEKIVPWSASRASWLLIKQGVDLTDEDRQALERMKQADEKVAEAYDLGQRFTEMVRERQHEALLPWLEDATNSGIEALKQFAKGIKQDLAAVTNALALPWSNGQTEGQVNRLKLIKRQMYGRANFDLLRKRVLFNPMRC